MAGDGNASSRTLPEGFDIFSCTVAMQPFYMVWDIGW